MAAGEAVADSQNVGVVVMPDRRGLHGVIAGPGARTENIVDLRLAL